MPRSIPLPELLDGLPVTGVVRDELTVSGVAHDSREVQPGDLFIAITGERFDGRRFAADAVERGAVAVLASGPEPKSLRVPWLITAEPRELMTPLAVRVYGHPDRELTVVGVTGTNGKSTISMLLRAVLDEAELPCGLLGSLIYSFGEWSLPAERTTPESSDLLRLLRRMRDEGAEAVAMEVSSHSLALGRVAEMRYDAAIFTNLSRDHFDFHSDFEDYYQAKKRLFGLLKPGGKAVINLDDDHGRRLASELEEELGDERVVTYGEKGRIAPRDVELSEDGITMTVRTPDGRYKVESQLLGRFNVSNLTGLAATAWALDLPRQAVQRVLERMEPIPGRLEPVDGGQPFPVYVDYSHTPDSLKVAIEAVREMTGKKVLVVFGCGGDRDPGKRPIMGRIAGELADLPLVTSDNPRTEDPMQIIAAVEEGLKESGNQEYRVVPDRREAIRRAITVAGPEWVVLIAGKGNEPVQIVGTEKQRFFDKEEAEKALEERFGPETSQ